MTPGGSMKKGGKKKKKKGGRSNGKLKSLKSQDSARSSARD